MTATVAFEQHTEPRAGAVQAPGSKPSVPAANFDRPLHRHTDRCWWDVSRAAWVCG